MWEIGELNNIDFYSFVNRFCMNFFGKRLKKTCSGRFFLRIYKFVCNNMEFIFFQSNVPDCSKIYINEDFFVNKSFKIVLPALLISWIMERNNFKIFYGMILCSKRIKLCQKLTIKFNKSYHLLTCLFI